MFYHVKIACYQRGSGRGHRVQMQKSARGTEAGACGVGNRHRQLMAGLARGAGMSPASEAGRADVSMKGLVNYNADAEGAIAVHGRRRCNRAGHSTLDVMNSLFFTIS